MSKFQILTLTALFSALFVLLSSFSVTTKAEEVEPVEETLEVQEQKYVSRKVWKADDNIRNENVNSFSEPKRIVFLDINPISDIATNPDYIKELYYFFTFKMALGDIPAHFIQDSSGMVYEGRFNGVDSVLAIDGYEKGDIVVFYLGDFAKIKEDTVFQDGYKKLLEMTGVDPEKTIIKQLDFQLDLKDKKSKIAINSLEDATLTEGLVLANQAVAKTWQKVNREYKIELGKVTYEKSPPVGSELNIQLEVKNNGDNNIYFDGESELFIVHNTDKFDSPSKLYSAKSWATKSRSSVMNETNSIVPKGKMAVLNFKASVPLMSGELLEKYILINKRGDKFEDTTFEIALDLDLGKKKVIEVKENEFGFLRVRKEPRGAAEEVTRILPGERYEWMERTDTGYYSIKLTDGTTGYVVGTYVKVVQ